MLAALEPCVRKVVEETLGVAGDELRPEVSLTDDLAADSLDLVEVALGLESALGIVMPERLLEEVRTYGDLVRATARVARHQHRRTADAPTGASVWARLILRRDGAEALLERSGWLTPYTEEVITADARRAGGAAHLELTVRGGTPDDTARVRDHFRPLAALGVEVRVRADRARPATRWRPAAQNRSASRTVWSRWAPIDSSTTGAPTRPASRST